MIKNFSHLCSLRPHTNVVQIQGVCTTSDCLMIVTEFVALGSLYYYLRSEKAKNLTDTQTLSIVLGIAAGMLHLSSENIIHR